MRLVIFDLQAREWTVYGKNDQNLGPSYISWRILTHCIDFS